MGSAKDIKTFAFLDLETSNLPDYNAGKTSITELSLIACSTKDVESPVKKEKLPRIVNKVTLCFNPAARIAPDSTDLSGLDNYMLEDHNQFDENAANIIKCFIIRLPQPVCLVAHNGDKFDFPVLKKHMQKTGVDLPEGLLCIDSISACKTLDRIQSETQVMLENGTQNCERPFTEPIHNSQEVENDATFQEVLKNEYTNILNGDDTNFMTTGTTVKKIDWQKLNETTPKRLTQQKFANKRNILGNDDTDSSPTKRIFKSRRELFPANPTNSPQSPNRWGAYKLGNIYTRLIGGKPQNQHRAEDDVVTLIEVATAYGKEFTKYAQFNAILLSDIPVLGSK